MFGQVLYSMGGTFLDAAGQKATFASPQGIAALEYWVDLVQKRRVSPLPWLEAWATTRPPAGAVKGTSPLDEAFLMGGNGGVAMRPFQTFSINQARAYATFKWVAVLPPQQPRLASAQGGGNWFMAKGARHRETGTALLAHLADAQQNAIFAVEIERLPTYKTVVAHAVYQDYLKKTPEMQVHWDTAQGAFSSSPPFVGWSDGEPALRSAIYAALQLQATPSAGLQDAARVMDDALAKGRAM
jgi:sn-glycerol 3-phosphate transport system substrate-binding protein